VKDKTIGIDKSSEKALGLQNKKQLEAKKNLIT